MSFAILFFFALIARNSATDSTDPKDYCFPQTTMVTEEGVFSGTLFGQNAVEVKHRVFSAMDFIQQKFYSNFSLTLIDTNAQTFTNERYEVLVDKAQNAQYLIGKDICEKYVIPDISTAQSSGQILPWPRRTECLSNKMNHQGSSYIGAYKSSPNALRIETFNMSLGDGSENNAGLMGQRLATFINNRDNPESYLQLKEVITGMAKDPQTPSNTISFIFSSDFVDYQEDVNEAFFNVPSNCPTEYSQFANDHGSRSRRASLSGVTQYAEGVMFPY